MCFLPLSALFIHIKDIWHSQGAVFQFGILLAYSYSFFALSKDYKIKNIPLALLTFWLGITTMIWWNMGIVIDSKYNFTLFMPFFNFLTMVIFYKLIIDYLEIKDLERIIKYFSYVIMVFLGYCVLQKFNLDQFHIPIDPAVDKRDLIVGTIGNPTHLAGYLSMLLPILYYYNSKLNTIGIFLAWLIIIMTGSSMGLIGAVLVTIFYLLFNRIRTKYDWVILGSMITLFIIAILFRGIDWKLFINPQGRLEEWSRLLPLLHKNPITGSGLGKIMSLGEMWKHAHCEYYQLAIETGVIGLGIAFYGIWKYFEEFIKLKTNKLAICLVSIFLAFLINALVSYPSHLWITSSLGMFAYSSLYCLKGEIQ